MALSIHSYLKKVAVRIVRYDLQLDPISQATRHVRGKAARETRRIRKLVGGYLR
jgi:hypothetical protein